MEYIRGSDYGGGIGGVLYTIRGGSRSYNAYNSRGDVVSQTNDSQAVTWQAAYEAFGTRTDEEGTNNERQKANTKDEDPTGYLNEGMRYRDLEFGVFITRDPAGFVDGPNVYTYVRQNPWSAFDPLGLNEEKPYRPRFWSGANLWKKSNTSKTNNNFIGMNKLKSQLFSGAAVRLNHGIVGTKKHGFVDIGHVRHNMDRTLAFHIQLSKMIKKDGSVPKNVEMQSHINRDSLPFSGTKPLPKVKTPVEVTAKNVHEISAQMAVTESNYYEDSTKGNLSYYSTEDLPSNKLGTEIAKKELKNKGVGYRPTTKEWGGAMDSGLHRSLGDSGALTRDQSHKMYNDYGPNVHKKTKGKNRTDKPVIFTDYEKK